MRGLKIIQDSSLNETGRRPPILVGFYIVADPLGRTQTKEEDDERSGGAESPGIDNPSRSTLKR